MIIYYLEYLNVLILVSVGVILVVTLFFLPFVFTPVGMSVEKSAAYECGFEPFDESRKSFDIQFYAVGVLFLVFDLELVFLFPWAVCLNTVGIFGFWVMFCFLFFLILGYFYEWRKGTLDWSFNEQL